MGIIPLSWIDPTLTDEEAFLGYGNPKQTAFRRDGDSTFLKILGVPKRAPKQTCPQIGTEGQQKNNSGNSDKWRYYCLVLEKRKPVTKLAVAYLHRPVPKHRTLDPLRGGILNGSEFGGIVLCHLTPCSETVLISHYLL